ncbi:hypothetical protein DPMN_078517 [Dreissena polymorpha]|uniref:Uncharacterized protein n=1 Tax=Dreissena polymorpha TaxID=45954 RepID=A0A9D3YQQ8_DREPO|nr:hypothetical protein DPMN_078517 [Dreissena polymorpha]
MRTCVTIGKEFEWHSVGHPECSVVLKYPGRLRVQLVSVHEHLGDAQPPVELKPAEQVVGRHTAIYDLKDASHDDKVEYGVRYVTAIS